MVTARGGDVKRDYEALAIRELGPGAGFRRPIGAPAGPVTLESGAVEVMTDLTATTPATIRPQAPIDAANQFMITRGVRLLLVVDEREVVLGLITATDILGEAAMRAATEFGKRHDELTVADLMTLAARVEVLAFADVATARVGHVLVTLRRAGRQHALVVDFERVQSTSLIDPPLDRAMVRGIFSLSQVARQLGVTVQTTQVARTFAEIESVLGH